MTEEAVTHTLQNISEQTAVNNGSFLLQLTDPLQREFLNISSLNNDFPTREESFQGCNSHLVCHESFESSVTGTVFHRILVHL